MEWEEETGIGHGDLLYEVANFQKGFLFLKSLISDHIKLTTLARGSYEWSGQTFID